MKIEKVKVDDYSTKLFLVFIKYEDEQYFSDHPMFFYSRRLMYGWINERRENMEKDEYRILEVELPRGMQVKV